MNLDHALERLESGEELPREPSAHAFVDWGGWISPSQISIVTSRKVYGRWIRQRERLLAKRRKEECQRAPVRCQSCEELFYRADLRRVRCDRCIQ